MADFTHVAETEGRAVIIDDSGNAWNGSAYAAFPSGSYAAGFLITPVQIGDSPNWEYTIPASAATAEYRILIYDSTTPATTDVPDAVESKQDEISGYTYFVDGPTTIDRSLIPDLAVGISPKITLRTFGPDGAPAAHTTESVAGTYSDATAVAYTAALVATGVKGYTFNYENTSVKGIVTTTFTFTLNGVVQTAVHFLQISDEEQASSTVTISPAIVSPKRTFYTSREGSTSRSIVTLNKVASGTVTLAVMPELNEGTTIDSTATHTVSCSGLTSLSVTNISVSPDGKGIHFDISAAAPVDKYTCEFSIKTVDGQTLGQEGTLRVN